MSTVILSGTGVLTKEKVIEANIGSISNVRIENYKSIGEFAFEKYDKMLTVTIPNSVISIGKGAFRACNSLYSVNIGNSVISIGESAFDSCPQLYFVTIGDSVTSIGNSAFFGCSFTEIVIPNSVISIGKGAFFGCSFTEIVIPNSVTNIGENAFNYSGLKTVFIENGQVISKITFMSPSPAKDVVFFGAIVSTALPTSNLQTSQPPGVVTITKTKYPIIFEVVSLLNKTNILEEIEMYARLLEILCKLLNNGQK